MAWRADGLALSAGFLWCCYCLVSVAASEKSDFDLTTASAGHVDNMVVSSLMDDEAAHYEEDVPLLMAEAASSEPSREMIVLNRLQTSVQIILCFIAVINAYLGHMQKWWKQQQDQRQQKDSQGLSLEPLLHQSQEKSAQGVSEFNNDQASTMSTKQIHALLGWMMVYFFMLYQALSFVQWSIMSGSFSRTPASASTETGDSSCRALFHYYLPLLASLFDLIYSSLMRIIFACPVRDQVQLLCLIAMMISIPLGVGYAQNQQYHKHRLCMIFATGSLLLGVGFQVGVVISG
jgi:hypothetical protein